MSGEPSSEFVRLVDVAVSYRGRRVLDGIDLRLEPATVFVLLGRNGAGKTTLIRTLCGRIVPDRGTLRILGRDPRRDLSLRRLVGFVPQRIALYPQLTVSENLAAFGGALRSNGATAAAHIGAVMEMVRVTEVADRRVGELSGGYQRRANVAAALIGTPRLLLMDEPTVGLDAEGTAVLVDVVRAIAASGTSVVLSTHDLDVATAAADRIGVLSHGRLAASGAPADVLADRFGDRKRVEVALRPTATRLAGALARLGLGYSAALGRWRPPAAGVGTESVKAILAAAAASRTEILSLTLGEPGLDDLFEALAAEGPPR